MSSKVDGFQPYGNSKTDSGGIDAMTLDATSSSVFFSQNGGDNMSMSETEDLDPFEREWGFPLDELFKLSLQFYKEKVGKAFHLTYLQKLRLVALTKQAAVGAYDAKYMPDVGMFDVVGNDRRKAWQALGDMSKDAAMTEFVVSLDQNCSVFRAHVEAHVEEKRERERQREEEESRLNGNLGEESEEEDEEEEEEEEDSEVGRTEIIDNSETVESDIVSTKETASNPAFDDRPLLINGHSEEVNTSNSNVIVKHLASFEEANGLVGVEGEDVEKEEETTGDVCTKDTSNETQVEVLENEAVEDVSEVAEEPVQKEEVGVAMAEENVISESATVDDLEKPPAVVEAAEPFVIEQSLSSQELPPTNSEESEKKIESGEDVPEELTAESLQSESDSQQGGSLQAEQVAGPVQAVQEVARLSDVENAAAAAKMEGEVVATDAKQRGEVEEAVELPKEEGLGIAEELLAVTEPPYTEVAEVAELVTAEEVTATAEAPKEEEEEVAAVEAAAPSKAEELVEAAEAQRAEEAVATVTDVPSKAEEVALFADPPKEEEEEEEVVAEAGPPNSEAMMATEHSKDEVMAATGVSAVVEAELETGDISKSIDTVDLATAAPSMVVEVLAMEEPPKNEEAAAVAPEPAKVVGNEEVDEVVLVGNLINVEGVAAAVTEPLKVELTDEPLKVEEELPSMKEEVSATEPLVEEPPTAESPEVEEVVGMAAAPLKMDQVEMAEPTKEEEAVIVVTSLEDLVEPTQIEDGQADAENEAPEPEISPKADNESAVEHHSKGETTTENAAADENDIIVPTDDSNEAAQPEELIHTADELTPSESIPIPETSETKPVTEEPVDEVSEPVDTLADAIQDNDVAKEVKVDQVLREVSQELAHTPEEMSPPEIPECVSAEAAEEILIKSLQVDAPATQQGEDQVDDAQATPAAPEATAIAPPVAPALPSPSAVPGLDLQSLILNLDPSQRNAIQTALNAQTAPHFKEYAAQQHPSDEQQQQLLIAQLQQQHFLQYMQQLYQMQFQQQLQLFQLQQQQEQYRQQMQQRQHLAAAAPSNDIPADSVEPVSSQAADASTDISTTSSESQPVVETAKDALDSSVTSSSESAAPTANQQLQAPSQEVGEDSEDATDSDAPVADPRVMGEVENAADENDDDGGEDDEELPMIEIAAASMWTRKDIREFKDALKQSGDAESMINVGHGETVTIRVPTHPEGTCLFWEFATDTYDLGFGLYFEWSTADPNVVSIQVAESSDEEDDEEEEEEEVVSANGGASALAEKKKREREEKKQAPPCDEIIPVYRRDCNEDVYCGSHVYPGQGVYLLKFDNSYSLWRSKNLYYRVYYTR